MPMTEASSLTSQGTTSARRPPARTSPAGSESDLVFHFRAPHRGRYAVTTYAATDADGTAQMRQANRNAVHSSAVG